MFKFLSNLFNHKKSKIAKNLSEKDVLCSINIELSFDNTISIRYFWPKFNEDNKQHINYIAKDFGTLFYMINNGSLEQDMIDTLSHTIDRDNLFDRLFTNLVIKELLAISNNELYERGPVISPLKVFGQYRQ